jgi:hypothetical protein
MGELKRIKGTDVDAGAHLAVVGANDSRVVRQFRGLERAALHSAVYSFESLDEKILVVRIVTDLFAGEVFRAGVLVEYTLQLAAHGLHARMGEVQRPFGAEAGRIGPVGQTHIFKVLNKTDDNAILIL